MKHPTSATTQSMGSGLDGRRRLLAHGVRIVSPETRLEYLVDRFLGEGGFGQAYLAQRLGRSTAVDETVCIKISPHIDGWLREAYFGQLLDDHPRAIRVFDAFPRFTAEGEVQYCLALEYARHGDLRAFLHRADRPWPESRV